MNLPFAQTRFPELLEEIMNQLSTLRAGGIPLELLTIRAIFLAYIQQRAPHLLKEKGANGFIFRCSNSFIKAILVQQNWSVRKATKPAGKLHRDRFPNFPSKNVTKRTEKSFLLLEIMKKLYYFTPICDIF
jgi:hypothetical protein